MKIQHEIEGLLSDISILQSENRRLTKRVHSLEAKIGNTNVPKRITELEQWVSNFENWMRRVESLLKEDKTE